MLILSFTAGVLLRFRGRVIRNKLFHRLRGEIEFPTVPQKDLTSRCYSDQIHVRDNSPAT